MNRKNKVHLDYLEFYSSALFEINSRCGWRPDKRRESSKSLREEALFTSGRSGSRMVDYINLDIALIILTAGGNNAISHRMYVQQFQTKRTPTQLFLTYSNDYLRAILSRDPSRVANERNGIRILR
ncbi:hypothetical protein NPIL_631141 [Nephila pilipes]|uniref:Uncharacterized protein n=1 Tax=Nephila pilipes TaxID=299642 RepID=A0A8X6MTM2_NEPPI|nr:hypothetical protein NPIL_631141 [Nephila pilipes]